MLTSREGGWKGPGVSLRRSEERRRLRLLREDSERSHSLPREAELCHYKRKYSQPVLCFSHLRCWFQPLSESPLGALPVSSPPLPFSLATSEAVDPGRSRGHRRLSMGLRRAAGGRSVGNSGGGMRETEERREGVSSCWRRAPSPFLGVPTSS